MYSHKSPYLSIFFILFLSWLISASSPVQAKFSVNPESPPPGFAIPASQNESPTNLLWYTFLGTATNDKPRAIAVDEVGRVYIVGTSDENWGDPVTPHHGGKDVFIAKFSQGGKLLWHTFLGSSGNETGIAIAFNDAGHVYIAGNSDASWGEPRKPFTGQQDIFVARLNAIGELMWHTFFGSPGYDLVNDMAFDATTNRLHLVGSSDTAWGDPLTPQAGEMDGLVITLDDKGDYQWHTFLGSAGVDSGSTIAFDSTGQVYVGGTSSQNWGQTIVNPHQGDRDAFVAQLNDQGALQWNTFLGTPNGSDGAAGIIIDAEETIFVAGYSWDQWGEPVNPFAGSGFFDVFAARLANDGQLTWHTFLGSPSQAANADTAASIALDSAGQVYLAGDSTETWGEPLASFTGERDSFVTRLNRDNGQRVWHTFLGGPDFDYSTRIALDGNDNIYLAGYSQAPWSIGQPVMPHAGQTEAFIAKLPNCLPQCSTSEAPATEPTAVAQAPTTPAEESASPSEPPSEATAEPADLLPSQLANSTPIATEGNQSGGPTSPQPPLSIAGLKLTDIKQVPLIENQAANIGLRTFGYKDAVTLRGPYDSTDYILTLPANWQVSNEAYLNLEISYLFSPLASVENYATPSLYGNIIVTIDDQTQFVHQLTDAVINNQQFQVPIPLDIFNDTNKNNYTVNITFDGTPSCTIPHDSRLTIHENSYLSLTYSETRLNFDLAGYPYPLNEPRVKRINQKTTEPNHIIQTGRVLFILPASPTQEELRAAVAVAARLGSFKLDIDARSDDELLAELAGGHSQDAHLVLIGSADRNKVIDQLNKWDTLPTPFRERRYSLSIEGPTTVKPGEEATYKLTVVNPTEQNSSAMELIYQLPPDISVVGCEPALCSPSAGGQQVSWPIESLAAGEMQHYAITVQPADTLATPTVLENSFMLLNHQAELLNLTTLTTTINQNGSDSANSPVLATAAAGKYFVGQPGWLAKETDGIVETLIAPWNPQQAILLVTGLQGEAVEKAGLALGVRQGLPGLIGSTALVNQIQPANQENETAPPTTNVTFNQVGYPDQLLKGVNSETDYSFPIPAGWRLAEGSNIQLAFNHSQLINFDNSSLRILFNDRPIMETLLDEQSSQNGTLEVALPADQSRPGRDNTITIQTRMEALNKCGVMENNWFNLNSNQSVLNLSYRPDESVTPTFDVFARPFNQRDDLANLLFVLPADPIYVEWREAIRVAALIGKESEGEIFMPHLLLGDNWSTDMLADYHVVVIGRPTRNSLLQQLNPDLPQSFMPETDLLEQRLEEVVLRSLPNNSLGIIQLASSPYGRQKAIMVVTGTTDEGLAWAGNTLARLYYKLLSRTNLAFIKNEEIKTLNTHLLTNQGMAEAVINTIPDELNEAEPTATPVSAETPAQVEEPATITETAPPQWLIGMVGVSAILIVATLALAYWQAKRNEEL